MCSDENNVIAKAKKNRLLVAVWGFYEELLWNNFLFHNENAPIGDNLLKPLNTLYRQGKKRNIDFVTLDTVDHLEDVDLYIFLDVPRNDSPIAKRAFEDLYKQKWLFICESLIVKPDSLNTFTVSRFDKIFTYLDSIIDNKKFFSLHYAFDLPCNIVAPLSARTRLCTMIAGAKSNNHALSLYNERLKAIRWFEQYHPEDFSLYGMGWNPLDFSSYKGAVCSKSDVLQHYKFSMCYENARDIPGYITEKIFDCFFAGCIPIYRGADNICNHVPKECFIDLREFSSYESLYLYISAMPEDIYKAYINNIRLFLRSSKSFPYSITNYCSTIIEHCLSLVPRDSLKTKAYANNKVKISICIPTYNRTAYLKEAIESALIQSYSNMEVIVSDNASTDGTFELCKQYGSNSRFRYYRNPSNIGGICNIEKCVHDLATGDYVLILSDDDYLYDPDYLSKVAQLIHEYGESVLLVFADYARYSEEYEGITEISYFNLKPVTKGFELFYKWWLPLEGYPVWVPLLTAVFNRKKALELNAFKTPEIMASDTILWWKLCLSGDVGFVNSHAAVYRVHGASDSTTADFTRYSNNIKMFIIPARFALDCGYDLQAIRKWKLRIALSFLMNAVGLNPVRERFKQSCVIERLTELYQMTLKKKFPREEEEKREDEIICEAIRFMGRTPSCIPKMLAEPALDFDAGRKECATTGYALSPTPINKTIIESEENLMHETRTNIKCTFHFSALVHKYCVGKGLEIGGSAHNPFGLNTLNVDFCGSSETIFKEEELRMCGRVIPVDIVARGDDIPLPTDSQDFVVSSHVLEHFPDPVRALVEWDRLVKPGGIIFMIVPHMERTFDKSQPRTTLQHIIDDFRAGSQQCDFDPHRHYHHWITEDIVELCTWMIHELGMRWRIVEARDVDDKVGNGFTIVIRKEGARYVSTETDRTPIKMLPSSVLFVVHGFPPTAVGGVEVYTRNLAKEMTSRGISVTVLYPVTDSSEPAYSITSDITDGMTLAKFHVPHGNLFTSITSQEIDNAFGSFLKSHSFDLVHFHHVFEHLSLSMVATAKETGVPVAITLHDFWFICPRAQLFIEENGTVCTGPESPAKCAQCIFNLGWNPGVNPTSVEEFIVFRHGYVRELLLKIDLLFSPSGFVADVFSRYSFGDNRITVAPLGIGKFAVNRSSSHVGPRFGYMGTIHPVKNILPLVRAFTATYGEARLDIFGCGETHRVNELKNGISDSRITYHGSYTIEQLPEILSNVDVLVVPSLIESYCLTVREALSVGIPVLAARVGGIPEIVRDGVNGILFDPFNNIELTRLLQQFINDRSLLQRLDGNAIPVKTITADAKFLLEQYAYRNLSVEQAFETNTVAVKQVSNLSLSNPIGDLPVKIKVAVFSMDSKEQACGYYRVLSPLSALRGEIDLSWGIEHRGNRIHIEPEAVESADIFVVQRFFPRPETADILDYLCSLGKPIIFEIDDLLTQLPPSNSSYGWGIIGAPHIYEFIRKCSAVTVSTEELKKHFSPYNDTIKILPNMLDGNLWRKSSPSSSGPVVIGYAGTITHNTDLALLEEVLDRIASKYGDTVAFTFMGCATERISRLPGFSYIQFETTFEAYARKLQEIPIDIMLVPLEDNPFNRCKSNIKWLEYSACGAAGIYADLAPYNTSVEQGRTGLLAGNNPQQWYEAISLLIENPDLRRSIAANARAEVLARYSLAANAHKWLDTYRTIIRNHTAVNGAGKAAPEVYASKPVSVIIPLFNKADYTQHCIEALTASTAQHLYELILIDNGSSDGTSVLLTNLPSNAKVIRNIKNQGFAKACNQGAQAASGKYLLFLNNDTEPQPGWLEPLLDTAEQDENVAAVGSKLLFPDGTIQHAGVVIADDRVTPDPLVGKHVYYGFSSDIPEVNITKEYQALTAASLLIRKDAFESVQGFDEGYWNGYEDVDLCFKLGQKGWKLIYQPASVVVHHESKSGSERFAKAAQNIQRLHEKWLGTIQPDVIVHPDSRVEWLERGASVATIATPLVSIIVPLFNQAQLTKACAETIRATAGDPRRYELILVDNGSGDWTPEYLKSLGTAVVVITNRENLGFAKACNQAARIAKGEYLLFLNNDTVPQPGWLDALLSGACEEGADIVGAKLLYPNGRVQHAGVTFNRNGIGYHIFKNFDANTPAVNKKRFMQCVTAACMLVSKQLFNDLDGFDEQFRNGFEDVDFCLRAGQVGKRVLYTPDAVVIHHEEQSEGRKQHDYENMQLYLTRWLGRVRCDDEELYAAEGFSVKWHADGTCVVRPGSMQEVNHENCRYPLIPLVGRSSSSILQKLSSSKRTKGVLNRYTAEE